LAQEGHRTVFEAGSARRFRLSYEKPAKSLCRLHIWVRWLLWFLYSLPLHLSGTRPVRPYLTMPAL